MSSGVSSVELTTHSPPNAAAAAAGVLPRWRVTVVIEPPKVGFVLELITLGAQAKGSQVFFTKGHDRFYNPCGQQWHPPPPVSLHVRLPPVANALWISLGFVEEIAAAVTTGGGAGSGVGRMDVGDIIGAEGLFPKRMGWVYVKKKILNEDNTTVRGWGNDGGSLRSAKGHVCGSRRSWRSFEDGWMVEQNVIWLLFFICMSVVVEGGWVDFQTHRWRVPRRPDSVTTGAGKSLRVESSYRAIHARSVPMFPWPGNITSPRWHSHLSPINLHVELNKSRPLIWAQDQLTSKTAVWVMCQRRGAQLAKRCQLAGRREADLLIGGWWTTHWWACWLATEQVTVVVSNSWWQYQNNVAVHKAEIVYPGCYS